MKNVSRRQYFHSLLAGALGIVDELRGRPHFRLDEIGSLPDAVLRGMTPVVCREITLSIEEGWLLLRNGLDGHFTRHMPLSARQIYILNCFDGRHSIADICGIMEAVFELSADAAAGEVRSLFATLAQQGICHPMESPE